MEIEGAASTVHEAVIAILAAPMSDDEIRVCRACPIAHTIRPRRLFPLSP
jgi:hypothetical protein